MRGKLRSFVELFPRNTLLLDLYAWSAASDSRLRLVDDPVRRVLSDVCLRPAHDCVSTRLLAIRHEAELLPRGVQQRFPAIAAAFEAALASDSCRGSAFLWRCYLDFCLEEASEESLLASEEKEGKKRRNKDQKKAARSSSAANTAAIEAAAARARAIFHRAVAACPWSKALYLAAFSNASLKVKMLGDKDLGMVHETMALEMGLRVHHDLEAMLARPW